MTKIISEARAHVSHQTVSICTTNVMTVECVGWVGQPHLAQSLGLGEAAHQRCID